MGGWPTEGRGHNLTQALVRAPRKLSNCFFLVLWVANSCDLLLTVAMPKDGPKDQIRKWVPFGAAVRKHRTDRGLSLPEVGARLGVSGAMVGSIERATRVAKRHHVDKMEVLFATEGDLLSFWRDTHLEGAIPEQLKNALSLERKATQLREYQSIIFPGVIQTADYARALVKARTPEATEDEVDEIVCARVVRLEALRKRGVRMWFLVDEVVLTRPIGSRAVLMAQLSWVEELVKAGTIRFQAIPLDGAPGLCAPYRVVDLGPRRQALYLENAMGGEIVDTEKTVREAFDLFSAMQAEALSTRATLELISQIKERRAA
ncbi:Scr1 family TA system antitoxin-like transcriptional regulator [Nocardiopsis sp. L17-MgMaSL7]|uniref:helix-turn-helix domain-containing protein n=1 Tax=Nocardiopsis sp. L17-MgMaSL7 TaxID=1938893 RepID=UPI000D711A69